MANDIYTNQEEMEREKKELYEYVEQLGNDLPTANIMVAGVTGSGKSTLINAVFEEDLAETGSGRPVTQQIDEYHKQDLPIRIWDTVGLEIKAETTQESIRSIKQTIAEKAGASNKLDRIHAIWYCVNSRSNRFQPAEWDFIKSLHSIGVPFVIVLTQCVDDEETVNAFEEEIRKFNASMGMSDVDVVQVIAKDFKIRGLPPVKAFGLEKLTGLTLERLPKFLKDGFASAQRVSTVQKREVSEDIIINTVQAAKEGFWEKIPLANIISTDRHIRDMFVKIGKIYNTMLNTASIDKITKESGIDFSNTFRGLISPIDFGYRENILNVLSMKKEDEGFDVDLPSLKKSDRSALMIAFYGYTFIESIEKVWQENTAKQLEDIDRVARELIATINNKLRERKQRMST